MDFVDLVNHEIWFPKKKNIPFVYMRELSNSQSEECKNRAFSPKLRKCYPRIRQKRTFTVNGVTE